MNLFHILCTTRTTAAAAVSGFLLSAAIATTPAAALELNQGAFVSGTTTYEFGYRSIPAIPVRGAPGDADWSRWAMLHDGDVYRLYAFKGQTTDTLYQFGFNRRDNTYEWGYRSIPVLRITGAPHAASANSFAMMHDGGVYRLYLQDRYDPTLLHQFGFNRTTEDYEYGYRSIPTLRVTGFPRDTDWSRWAMLHDGSDYRFYAALRGSRNRFYQAGYNARVEEYQFGYHSIEVLSMEGFPRNSNTSSFAMLHDGLDFRFYFKNR